jgi:exosortase O
MGGMLAYRWWFAGSRQIFLLKMNNWTTALLVISAGIFLLNEQFIAINIFSAVCALIALYALLSFFIEQTIWKKGLLFMLLAILFLPFGDYLDVFMGFPLRLMSAQAASDLLVALGFEPQNTQMLIELDNRLTYVDLSCSGIRGLWSGLGFWVLLTWLEQKSISWYWWLLLVVFLALIIALNILRITAMVLITDLSLAPQYMDMLHNALGIIGFAFACMLGWLLLVPLKSQSEVKAPLAKAAPQASVSHAQSVVAWLLAGVMIGFYLIYSPMLKTTLDSTQLIPEFSRQWHHQAIPLDEQEAEFFPRQGAYAQKYRFHYQQEIEGAMILVNTLHWKAHHDPKNCFQAQGYNLLDERSRRVAAPSSSINPKDSQTILLRQLELSRDGRRYRAYYWFQSPDQQTADFSQRLFWGLFSRVTERQKPWTMVSLNVTQDSVGHSHTEQQLLLALSELTRQWVDRLSQSPFIVKEQSI